MAIKFKHCLIIGQSQSGKSTKAKQICRDYFHAGRKCLVLDPLVDEWDEWDCDFITDDPDELLRIAQEESKGCAIFLDESLTALKKNSSFDWLTTTGRHNGHEVYVISHRMEGVTPTMRLCCIQLYVFNIDQDSAKDVARLFNRPELAEAPTLEQGGYFWTERMLGHVERGNVFDEVYGQNDAESEELSQDDIDEYDVSDDEDGF